ncbi:MAG TPA: DNA polymerase Y family protein [Burkholderiaceae bacterium]|nr:DNA polymerase Y family protein [Burkholderiaceae bacterium]
MKSIWLALNLPALSLQLAQRALNPALARNLPLAIVDGSAQRKDIVFCNGKARSAGVLPGMKLAAAQALTRDLVAIQHDAQRERTALQELACWAYQFSAHIVPFQARDSSGLLIETGASERLFGGRDALRRRIVGALRSLGYRAADASAATPAAARILACARGAGLTPPDAVELGQLLGALGQLPLRLLGWDDQVIETLHALGLSTIGEVMALPREAFARRFGAQQLSDLDRMLGALVDPQPPFSPPEQFRARIELPADLIDVGQLTVPLHRLLRLLEGFLRGHGAGATTLLLRIHHSARRERTVAPTTISLALAVPERDAQRLLRLLTERLDRTSLPEPAILIELELERMAQLVPRNASFLPPAPQSATEQIDALQLAETLHARLGSAGVFQLQALSDHRPEFAYRVVPLAPDLPYAQSQAPLPTQRPSMILPAPRRLQTPSQQSGIPHYGGPLALLAGPERIEAGWWDLGQPQRATVHRDYFVARNRNGQTLWVYRELAAPHNWFLHGFFA